MAADRPRFPRALIGAAMTSGGAALLALLIPGACLAQSDQAVSIPGLVITQPSQPGARPEPQAAPERATTPPVKPKAASKPRPPQREASAEEPKRSTPTPRIAGQGIAVLVNDEPITAYEIEQRAAFLAASSGGAGITERARANMQQLAQSEKTSQQMRALLEETVKANQGKTREQVIAAFEERKKHYVQSLQRQAVESARASLLPSFKKQAVDELIEERLKLQEAKRLNIATSEGEADKIFKGIADRNKMTEQQFADHLKSQGIDAQTMKSRLRAQSAWRDVIRRKLGPMISITAREVDRFVASAATGGEEAVELQLQKIVLAVPGKIDQKIMAQRLEAAEALRGKFTGCKSTAELAKGVAGAKFEDLGYKAASTVSEPTRSLLLNAKDGEMVPGSLAQSGVELYAVCGRRTVKADEQKRQQAQEELTQKEFEILAKRYLRDLRQDAMIEYK
jgi:peptidyl-prolyl cis-trans isomerase SurA